MNSAARRTQSIPPEPDAPRLAAISSLRGRSGHLVEVKLLGPPRIACAGVRVESRLSAQTALVLAMLLLRSGEQLSREEVAFTLWPDASNFAARAALRRNLYKLRRALPDAAHPWLDCGTRTVAWAPSSETWIDVREFVRLSESPATFEAAARLYEGEFAPYIDHEWVAGIRASLKQRICAVLEQLVRIKRAAGDPIGTLRYLEQLLVHDPWREDALRDLMLLRSRAGDRAGALAYFRNFRVRLRAEFDVDPMPETMRCLESIARGCA